jgi:hypothetical protein
MASLMLSHAGFFFQNHNSFGRESTSEMVSSRQTDNSATNYRQVECCHAHAPTHEKLVFFMKQPTAQVKISRL